MTNKISLTLAQGIFAELTNVNNRDHAAPSEALSRIYAPSTREVA